jgi:hypothetical protein
MKHAMLAAALLVAFSGCDPKKEMEKIEGQVASDAVQQYELARKGGDKIEICVHAGLVTAAYLQAKDEPNYLKWKEVEKRDCKKAGMPK